MFKAKNFLIRTAAFCTAVLVGAGSAAFAADFPNSIWDPLKHYESAQAAGDDSGIYTVGKNLIGIMEGQPESQTKTEFLSGKYYQVAIAAENLGYFDEAIDNYRKYIPYGEKMNQTDGITFAKGKINVLASRLNVYFKDNSASRPNTFFGAKLEPSEGVLFGSVYDNDPRIGSYDESVIKSYFPKENSMNLVYFEFGDDITALGRYEKYFSEIKKSNAVVMFAWNTYSSLGNIEDYADYIRKTVDWLGNSGLKIILRFGNEMNVGSNGDVPADYIKSFRYVADIAHTKSNIAMCWSPNDVGALDRPFENYYPGNEYVDWVGVSLYTSKYFQGVASGTAEEQKIANTYFLCGEYADPVLKLGRIVSFMNENGIAKPIAVTECGAPYRTNNASEDCTEWGVDHLNKIYGELVRVYPQLKAICYFNVQRPNEPQHFELSGSDRLCSAYNKAVEDGIYLTEPGASAGFAYNSKLPSVVEGGTLELSASAYYPGLEQGKVVYCVDGSTVGAATESPYRFGLDCSGLSAGRHTLTVKLVNLADYELISKSFDFEVKNTVKVYIDGEELAFTDCSPFISNNRTLVPLRVIFTALGAEIDWNDDTQTVTSVKGDTTVRLTIGEKVLYKNGMAEEIDVPAQLVNNRTVVPVRAVAQSFGANVEWNEATQSVLITTK